MDPLFTGIAVGPYHLKNRIAMAPLTRRRAGDIRTPNDLMALYYRQRASAGLIIAEATDISLQGIGYLNTPGIHTPAQVEAWKKITTAVHEEGGTIFLQLWHEGRISHPLLQPGQQLPVAPSAIKAPGLVNTPEGRKEMVTPRALDTAEIPGIVEDFAKAARNAIEAGFDGVEIHGANGYLPDQFLNSGTNKRTDEYGGSVENRARFLFEIMDAVTAAIGAELTSLRLSPSGIKFDVFDPDPVGLFSYVTNKLNQYSLAYLHITEPSLPVDEHPHYLKAVAPYFRKIYRGTLISCGGYTPEKARKAVAEGIADMVAFGQLYIANPDLAERIRKGAPLNIPDNSTYYDGGEKGYTDYPFLRD